MRNRTRVLIKIDGANGAQLVDSNKSVDIRILPDTAGQIEAGKKYLAYLTKLIIYDLPQEDGAIVSVNDIIAVQIDGLSTETNNLNLNSTVQKLPIIGIATLTKASSSTDLIDQVSYENPHPKDDGIICSNPFNKQLKVKLLDLDDLTYFNLSEDKYIIEIMFEEICDC